MIESLLLDAAFRLISHSSIVEATRLHPLTTDADRLAELRRLFPQSDLHDLQQADIRAQRLKEAAIELADTARDLPFDVELLVRFCPGFSSSSYEAAMNDGYVLTRK